MNKKNILILLFVLLLLAVFLKYFLRTEKIYRIEHVSKGENYHIIKTYNGINKEDVFVSEDKFTFFDAEGAELKLHGDTLFPCYTHAFVIYITEKGEKFHKDNNENLGVLDKIKTLFNNKYTIYYGATGSKKDGLPIDELLESTICDPPKQFRADIIKFEYPVGNKIKVVFDSGYTNWEVSENINGPFEQNGHVFLVSKTNHPQFNFFIKDPNNNKVYPYVGNGNPIIGLVNEVNPDAGKIFTKNLLDFIKKANENSSESNNLNLQLLGEMSNSKNNKRIYKIGSITTTEPYVFLRKISEFRKTHDVSDFNIGSISADCIDNIGKIQKINITIR